VLQFNCKYRLGLAAHEDRNTVKLQSRFSPIRLWPRWTTFVPNGSNIHSHPYWSHSVPRLWINSVIIIMSLASLCHHYMLTVICRLHSLSSLSLQTSVSSVAFCKHQVTQQLVRHPGSVRPDEQNSVAKYIIHFSSKSMLKTFCQDHRWRLDTKTLDSRITSLISSQKSFIRDFQNLCSRVWIQHIMNIIIRSMQNHLIIHCVSKNAPTLKRYS